MTEALNKSAYLKAQKKRSIMIALGLVAFVVLIFLVSMVRMQTNLKTKLDNEASQKSLMGVMGE